MSRRRAIVFPAIALAAALLLAGCGDEGAGPTTSGAATTASTTTEPTGEARIETGDGEGGVALEQLGDFEQPVYVAQPDGDTDHLYVVEQCGRILRIPYGGGEPTVFLDISDQVRCGGEQGLLSLAFDPGYARTGRFFVYFTENASEPGDARVVEYNRSTDEPAVADPDSARQMLRIPDFASNHNGGLLLFGPDGKLYIGTGDGGGAGDPERTAQDPASRLGKILRIDGSRTRVAALGLRNPWRFSFDRVTGDLWIGDVGQDSLEEVDAATREEATGNTPLNFGWSAFEGTERFNEDQEAPDARPPLLEYPTDAGDNCAITGGYVARDPSLPTLFGRYLYGDYCAGELRSFSADPSREADDDGPLGVHVPALSSFGEDVYGHLYAVSLDGPVYRLLAEATG